MTARILVVEDEFFIACEIADALEDAGFAVVGPCASVQTALAQLDACERCDAAVLDASLRQAPSLPVVQALVERAIPFVVVTGFSAGQLPGELMDAPVLTKPLNAPDLIAALRRLLPAG